MSAPPRATAPPTQSAPPRATADTVSVSSVSSATLVAEAPRIATHTAPQDAPQLDDTIREHWSRAIASVNPTKRMLGAFLEECSFQGVAGDAAHLAMDSLHQAVIDAPEHRTMIHAALTQAFGRTMTLKCVPFAPGEAPRPRTEAEVRPMIDKAREFFDGEPIERRSPKGDR